MDVEDIRPEPLTPPTINETIIDVVDKVLVWGDKEGLHIKCKCGSSLVKWDKIIDAIFELRV